MRSFKDEKFFIVLYLGFFFFSLHAYGEITDAKLNHALVIGSSLVEMRIISVHTIPEKYVTLQSYGMEIVKPLLLGDFEPDDLKEAHFSSRGGIPKNELKQGSSYALFIQQDTRQIFSWCCPDDFMEIVDEESLECVKQRDLEIYDKSFIKIFRDFPIDEHPDIHSLPDSIVDLLKLFRENPEHRREYAKQIERSSLGSRKESFGALADSTIQSTTKSPIYDIFKFKLAFPKASSAGPFYLIPEISLSRSQALFLFGAPSAKHGRWYYLIYEKNPAPEESGVFVVCFDEQMKSNWVYYDKYQHVP
jgi:hypothetical protein